ncbi:uncharacterized protein [Fopius arisanus]|uniref:Endonuclease/exonuclease/phosphatase domain-containing protein n=1 Tax=Fopius arisanus TaxID=64838 RepID=A0A9R1TR27_9HYME|nr:PREDICTED: uncharacterized protein LOC105272962 [Fopius arisanus]
MVNFCHRDLVAVMLGLRGEGRYEDIVFCSAYFPFDSALPPPTGVLRKLVRYCKSNGLPLIVGCDANGQNVVWGSQNNNARGTSLLEYLADVDLEILNRGSSPSFVTSRCQCVIDITLCDRRLAKRNPRTTDCTSFKEELEARLGERRLRPSNVRRLEDEVDTIHDALIGAFHKACPIKASRQGKKVAWWSRKLNRLRVLPRRLWNHAYRTKSHEDWIQYRNVQREYKRLIKKSKETAWKEFCDDLEALPQGPRFRRAFSGDQRKGWGRSYSLMGRSSHSPATSWNI